MTRGWSCSLLLCVLVAGCPLPSAPCAAPEDCTLDQVCRSGRCESVLGLPLVPTRHAGAAPGSSAKPQSVRPFADWPMRDDAVLREDNAEIATDENTGLQWMRQVLPQPMPWADAVAACQGAPLRGGQWRLPTRLEYLSLFSYPRSPAIDRGIFPAGGHMWSASRGVDAGHAWCVYLGGGELSVCEKTQPLEVLCVRCGVAAECPAP